MFIHMRNKAASLLTGSPDRLFTRPRGQQERCACAYPAGRILTRMMQALTTALLFAVIILLTTPAITQAAEIINSAWLYGNSQLLSQSSVTVSTVQRTAATIELFNYYPAAGGESINVNITGQSPSGSETGPFVPLPVVSPFGSTTPFDLSNPLTLNPTAVFHVGEPLFLRTTDGDQNLDPTLAETIVVTVTSAETGDREVLLLIETGSDSGIFSGYLGTTAAPAGSDNGLLSLIANGTLTASYYDSDDGSDSTTAAALVDPFGLVFDSTTGQPIDGVTVTLVDAASGLPATVMGDDGVSSYPSSVISGATTTDSSGHTYTPPVGGYRFPLIASGDYRLEITPPEGYRAPSIVPTALIQMLPGAPFSIESGSRGGNFAVNPGPTIQIDIPIDSGPGATGLWVKKETNKSRAAIGDFVA
ncbi:MAG: hypothetical protein DRH06_01845, partial [Deltaproteobacteria bacterium]